jgi:hypothetical protein
VGAPFAVGEQPPKEADLDAFAERHGISPL